MTEQDGTAGLSASRVRPRVSPDVDDSDPFFDRSLDLLCVAGFDGYFTRLNPMWTACLGWSIAELKAEPFLHFVHPGDRDATRAEVAKLGEGVATILFENRYRHRDGSYRWLQWNAWTLAGDRHIYAAARDVSTQKRLEQEILAIADEEKERLGRELHDGLCQSLAGIVALSSTLARRLKTSAEPKASAAAIEIASLLNDAIGEARDMARGLGPVAVDGAGLAGALEGMTAAVQSRFRVPCTFVSDGSAPGIGRETQEHLFRIAQEAVRNAVVHAHADRIKISLLGAEGKGILRVRDTGVGLPDEARVGAGTGLRTMAVRARLIGGSFEIGRQMPHGTVVTCVFPSR